MDIFQKMAEHKITTAIENNELDVPELHGQKIEIGPYSAIQEVMQRFGALPREAVLMKKLEKLKAEGVTGKVLQDLDAEIAVLKEIRLAGSES